MARTVASTVVGTVRSGIEPGSPDSLASWKSQANPLSEQRALFWIFRTPTFRSVSRSRAKVLHEPQVLFLDEPTIGLDLPNRRRIWRFIQRLRARTGMTVLLTTHYLEEANPCDRVCFIRKGRLVDAGAPLDLVGRLGRHILEIESDDLETLTAQLEPKLGECLIDGDVAFFRHADEDLSTLARMQTETGSAANAWRVRRPNLNDVFLWISAGKVLKP